MRCSLLHAIVIAALLPTVAHGQPVFFDDFDGDDLAPHWSRPPADHWQYSVAQSRLTVTGLFNPGGPNIPNNSVTFSTQIAPTTPFRVTTVLGWQDGLEHGLDLLLRGPENQTLANFGYNSWDTAVASIAVQTVLTPPLYFPTASSGTFEFVVERSAAGQYRFYVDDVLVTTLAGNTSAPLATIGIRFVGPNPGPMEALHIDSILVIPAPPCGFSPLLFAVLMRRRDR